MEEFSILSKRTLLLSFISILLFLGVRSQDYNTNVADFINIDCGYEGEEYKDTLTNLTYKSDASLIDRGVTHKLSKDYYYAEVQLATLRSFPNDRRICYALRDLRQNAKYLIRAVFMYGNYDGLNNTLPIQFDLHLGLNLWKKIIVTSSWEKYTAEVLTAAKSDSLTVCLVAHTGTLFMSALELRPLPQAMYPAVDVSNPPLVLNSRQNMGASAPIRFPLDMYDRIWVPLNSAEYWRAISTESEVRGSPKDVFRAPSAVLQTAVVPAAGYNALRVVWTTATDANGIIFQYHIFMYFAELINISSSRTFNVYLGDSFFNGPFTPAYLFAGEIYTVDVRYTTKFSLEIRKDKTSMDPPILNALETYTLMTSSDDVPTNATDVAAITRIKEQYGLKRNWMGDPCAPKLYAWDGLVCKFLDSSPRIIALNLSSTGLTGYLDDSFRELTAITNLDLSENNLDGTIPEFLADITSLEVLNLSGNDFIGSVPSGLLSRSATHSLTLSVAGNPRLCTDAASCPIKKKKPGNTRVVLLSAIIIIPIIVVMLLLLLCICKKRRKQQGINYAKHKDVSSRGNASIHQVERLQFTYLELQNITNGFKYELGKGGFGSVYHGRLESGSEVAVKMRSQASTQGTREFLAEVELLMRIHHRNLVSLVGYCNDGNYLALVYEYMSEGNLAEHLRGKTQKSRGLCWEERLQIAIEAAEGLDYLHKGCDPPIVHRDVKTSNILLHTNLQTKIADFGLSKVFHNNDFTHVSTGVAGTPGYLDPEYNSTFQLTRKSDVYSFGVVLLELVTGQSPIIQGPDKHMIQIVQWIRPWLAQGDLGNLVDPTLEAKGGYGVDTVWKVIDIALQCTAPTSVQRPDMASVVAHLKEALALETTSKEEAPAGFTMEMHNMSERRVAEISLIGGPSAR